MRTENESLIQEIMYYAREFEKKRAGAVRLSKAATIAVLVLGVLTFFDTGIRPYFYLSVLVYSSLLVGLFTRATYIIDSHFYTISKNLKDRDTVQFELAKITVLAMRSRPYPHLEQRLRMAFKLRQYLDQHKTFFD